MASAASQALPEPASGETSRPTRADAALPDGRVRPRSVWRIDPHSGTLSLLDTLGRRPVNKRIEGKFIII